MTVVGGLEDQIVLLVWPHVSAGFFSLLPNLANHFAYQSFFLTMINPLATNEPLLFTSLSVFLHLFGEGFYNLFLLVTLSLNLLISYILFRRYRFGMVYALIFSFSTYVWIHLGVHPALTHLWLIALFVHLLLKFDNEGWTRKRILMAFLVLLGSILISNYIGFLLLIFLSLYALFTRGNLRYYLLVIFGSIAVSAIILWPFIRLSYFTGSTSHLESVSTRDVRRPYEDFFHFSSRPWYFVTPPVKNPWLGEFSREVLERISDTNYFLADDYFPAEHQGNYFGLLLLFSGGLAFLYSLRSHDQKLKQASVKYAKMFLVIWLLMFPPFFTISGITFFTPGHLMYKFFPMFRVTSRLSVLLLLLLLLILAPTIDSLYKKLFEKKKLFYLFSAALLAVTLFETYIPLKMQKVESPSPVYAYMRESLPAETKFVVSPFDRVDVTLLWLPTHQQHLVNTRYFDISGMPSDKVTANLVTPEGIRFVKDLGVEYLLVYKDVSQGFPDLSGLELIYEDQTALLYKIL